MHSVTPARICAALLALLIFPAHVGATLVVDLRFPNNTPQLLNYHTAWITPNGGTYAVEVWAQVRGTNTTGTDEGLYRLFGSIQSQQINAGAILSGTSGVTGNTGSGPFMTFIPGQTGTAQNLTADGVQDWGTTASSNINTIAYASSYNSGLDAAFYNNPGVIAHLLDEGMANAGVEFEVGLFTVTINPGDVNTDILSDGETLFHWFKGTGFAPTTHRDILDGVNETNAATYLASGATNSVKFTLTPEPGSAAISCAFSPTVCSQSRQAHIARYKIDSMPNPIPAVRILPMSDKEQSFRGRSIENVQKTCFLRDLPAMNGRYRYRSTGLNADRGTVVLFQFKARIIASAVFLRDEKFERPIGGHSGALWFDPKSFRVFDPLDADAMRKVWPSFRGFGHVKQFLNPVRYGSFVRRLKNVASPA